MCLSCIRTFKIINRFQCIDCMELSHISPKLLVPYEQMTFEKILLQSHHSSVTLCFNLNRLNGV